MLIRVTIAIDPSEVRDAVAEAVRETDFLVTVLKERSPLEVLGREPCDFLIASESRLHLPPEEIAGLAAKIPEPPVLILIVEEEDEERRAELLACGCDAVLNAGLPRECLLGALRTILHKRSEKQTAVLHNNRRRLQEPRLSDFASASPAMQTFLNIAHRVVRSDSSLLILGETGVGKERLALAVHGEGTRAGAPFIPVNCAALPDSLLESELFGHEQGAFTGATRTRRGAFELAHRGTIFLDEIGDMPVALQVKLLRVLQDRRFVKLGGERPIKVDVRVMAATNRDLTAEVEAGRFRRDLYYRLGVITLMVPPLRERCEDIPQLVGSYVRYLAPRIGVEEKRVEPEALRLLMEYEWPGNVRELINVLERALLLCDGAAIRPEDLPEEIGGVGAGGAAEGCRMCGGGDDWLELPWRQARQQLLEHGEREYLRGVLRQSKGRIAPAAQLAGITTRALYEKMRKYALDKTHFKTVETGCR